MGMHIAHFTVIIKMRLIKSETSPQFCFWFDNVTKTMNKTKFQNNTFLKLDEYDTCHFPKIRLSLTEHKWIIWIKDIFILIFWYFHNR